MPQDAASLCEWKRRIDTIYASGKPPPCDVLSSLADAGPARLRELAHKYKADYLVTQVGDPPPPLPPDWLQYKNDTYVVYRIR